MSVNSSARSDIKAAKNQNFFSPRIKFVGESSKTGKGLELYQDYKGIVFNSEISLWKTNF